MSDPSDFKAARAACRRDDWIAWYLAHFLPREKADGAMAIAATCRMVRKTIAGSAIEGGCCGGDVINRINGQIEGAFAANLEMPLPQFRDEGQHVLAAFAQTARRFEIPRFEISNFISACAADAATMRYATWNALRRHCEGVGGSVAGMIACVLGGQHSDVRRHAGDLGVALRQVSILQSIRSDAARGRVYLPIEDLARCRYSERELLDGAFNERFAQVLKIQSQRARKLLDVAADQLCWLAGDGSRIAAATLIEATRATLQRIDRGDFAPSRPSLGRMIRLLPRAAQLARRQGVAG